jgi:phosphoribosylamine--glycine ligase
VIGSGGREHALAAKLASERNVSEVICVPGNPGIATVARCIPGDQADPHALVKIAAHEEIDLTVVGPELPLSRGVADLFAAEDLLLLGPTQRAARLESSKVFAKEFMKRCGIPTARYSTCDTPAQAESVLNSGAYDFPVVLKADGLAAGKGVVICADVNDALSEVHAMMVDKRFGAAGARLVIEECLIGREASFFVLCDGTRAVPLGSAEDHKRALDGDLGPNTGGMGAYAPSAAFTGATEARVMSEIVLPVLDGMRSEGDEFRGFLFVGLMLTAEGPKVIEFNVRLGDPEAQVVLPMVADDLSGLLGAAAAGQLATPAITMRSEPHVGVVLASGGYPDGYDTGKPIHGVELAEAMPDVQVLHSGTARRGTDLVTAGGRVLTVVGRGTDYHEAGGPAFRAAAPKNILCFD